MVRLGLQSLATCSNISHSWLSWHHCHKALLKQNSYLKQIFSYCKPVIGSKQNFPSNLFTKEGRVLRHKLHYWDFVWVFPMKSKSQQSLSIDCHSDQVWQIKLCIMKGKKSSKKNCMQWVTAVSFMKNMCQELYSEKTPCDSILVNKHHQERMI